MYKQVLRGYWPRGLCVYVIDMHLRPLVGRRSLLWRITVHWENSERDFLGFHLFPVRSYSNRWHCDFPRLNCAECECIINGCG